MISNIVTAVIALCGVADTTKTLETVTVSGHQQREYPAAWCRRSKASPA